MTAPVIAIGLDAMAPKLLERWVEEGKLPHLARLFGQGTYARQANFGLYRVENSWLTLLQGCSPETSHEWGHQDYKDDGGYNMVERASYQFTKYPPFYALPQGKRVAIFDLPLTRMVDGVDGVQLLGWGTEVNQILRQSSPPGLMAQLIAKHGRHPLYDTITNADDGSETLSYRIPSLYNSQTMREVRDQLVTAAGQRTAILKDLMAQERWDLLLAAYGEIHTAGHLFWHLSQPHALFDRMREQAGGDFLLDVAQAVDRGVGELVAAAPADTQIFIFSPHGMRSNTLDMSSMLFLPELIYRWSTGKPALCYQDIAEPIPEPSLGYSRHWREEVWGLRTPHGEQALESPLVQSERGDPLDWDPGNWFRPQWAGMRAFALPGYSEGLIRLNIAGRDGPDGIAPQDFTAVCDELRAVVAGLVDARTGKPLASKVLQVRQDAMDNNPDQSPADLMVQWREGVVTDVVEHPKYGRIGPVPFFRTGGHSTVGFMLAIGEGFGKGVRLPVVKTQDVTATLLQAMGGEVPAHIEGAAIARGEGAAIAP
ncbi:alkaline phosphatase family protein [Caenimonas sp. SL110]|uniref:alkaline phosphatase family protein n=1 Tax=Caenimonas sp. SL110 TaxID=1450524 RepID=UPI00069F4C15|nr:alkaline phosphatase family protein [Caenimonas sp. SL110]